ncbi:MAG: PTS sugar transporter subunit IIA [Desulfobulbaceae bacterium]|nr:PTS sugar transporter subunit IIA [Desulfobulbaceae bacterium]
MPMVLKEKNILLDIKAKNKESVLRELAEVAHQDCPQVDLEVLYQLLLEREQIGSTGVGNGVAIPHARIENLDAIQLCFGRTNDGIGFDAIDNQPVHFIVMILSPVDQPEKYLKTLATVSRFLKKPELRRQLRLAENSKKIVEIFKKFH